MIACLKSCFIYTLVVEKSAVARVEVANFYDLIIFAQDICGFVAYYLL